MTDHDLLDTNSQPLILLGNDQEWSARSLESLLAPAGFRTIRAYTGGQLLQIASTRAVDAILVDRSLPDMCGTEAVTRLRGLPGFDPATPVSYTHLDVYKRQPRT